MTAVIAPVLFTEARLNVESTTSTSTFHISTESSSLFSSRKRLRLDGGPATNEDDFTRRNLASDSSIFFRSTDTAPRSILWRVLDDGKVLELQCVDLIQDQRAISESLLTFRLSFANPIRPNGVAFADSHSHDALEVFVLTTSNELFTFSLRRELLLRANPIPPVESDSATVVKSYALSSFSFRHPHKLVAVDDLQLLVSLGDSSLLHLERRAGENGSAWKESYYAQGGIATSLRSLIPWKAQDTVRHGNVDLSSATAADMQVSPDGEYVFTVSLDHTLKAWTTKSGKPGFQIDLMGEDRLEPRGQQQYLIGPGQSTFLKVVAVDKQPDGDSYYCVVWSPKHHQFKVWAVRDPASQDYGVRDVQPSVKLSPPLDDLMGTNVWQLADFDIKPGTTWRDTQLWIRARSGSVVRTFTLTFDLLASADEVDFAFKHQWAAVHEGTSIDSDSTTLPQLRFLANATFDEDISAATSDEWLDFLLYPGRFTADVLETALSLFQKKSSSASSCSQPRDPSRSFQERLREVIATKIGAASGKATELTRHKAEVAAQWRAFFQIVKYLHGRRGDSLSLALDRKTGLCWSVRAEQVAPIRACSEIEVYQHNETILHEQDDEWIVNSFPLADFLPDDLSLNAARLFAAARSFRYNLSTHFNKSLSRLSSTFALRDSEVDFSARSRKTASTPLQQLYEQCDFALEVGDDDFNALTDSVQDLGGLGELENNIFEFLLERLHEQPRGQEREHALARYGDKATITCAQDALIKGRETLLDVLALVVFMSQDLETDELARGFKPLNLYALIASKLREHDVLLWLASHVRTEHEKDRRSSGSDSLGSSENEPAQPTMTVLESIFIGDWQNMTFPETELSTLLTYSGRAWAFGSNLSVNYDGVTAHVISNLIKHEDFDLAAGFVQFLPHNSWTTYLTGRLYLGQGDYEYASTAFKAAAADLGLSSSKRVTPVEAADTANLIPATQRGLFNAGRPQFYMHCCYLFETARLPSQAADFASLGLDELDETDIEATDSSLMEIDQRKRGLQDSPAVMRVDLAMEEIRLLKTSELKDDLLCRLFTNALQTARYETAFSALVRFTDPAMKHSSLTRLLTALLPSSPSTLLSLPLPASLDPEVDATLLALARKSLSGHASSVASSPSHIQLLYSYRISRENYRGAAESLYEYLQWLKRQDESEYDAAHRVANGLSGLEQYSSPEEDESRWETEVGETYLLLINTLACCGTEAWILAEAAPVRKVVTLEDMRREYQAELDRRSEIAHGRFPLIGNGGDGMEVDVF